MGIKIIGLVYCWYSLITHRMKDALDYIDHEDDCIVYIFVLFSIGFKEWGSDKWLALFVVSFLSTTIQLAFCLINALPILCLIYFAYVYIYF